MAIKNLAGLDESGGALNALYAHMQQEAEFKALTPGQNRDSKFWELQYQFYKNLHKAYRKSKNKTDRQLLGYISYRRRLAKSKINPTLLKRLINSKQVTAVRNLLYFNYKKYSGYDKTFARLEKEVIQKNNIEILQKSLRERGFADSLEGPLREMVSHNMESFTVRHSEPRHPNTDFVLYFKKIPGTENYIFEKFDATARPDLGSVVSNDPSSTRRTFEMVNPKTHFSADEASRMVNDYAVYKNINGEDHWFAALPPGHNQGREFILEKELAKFPIKELDNVKSKRELIDALKKGNAKEVTLKLPNGERKLSMNVSLRGQVFKFREYGNIIDVNKILEPFKSSLNMMLYKKSVNPEAEKALGNSRRYKVS